MMFCRLIDDDLVIDLIIVDLIYAEKISVDYCRRSRSRVPIMTV